MAILTDRQREEVRAEFAALLSVRRETIGNLRKPDLRAAVDSTDQHLEDDKANFDGDLPLPARNELTSSQKSELLSLVTRRRLKEGR